MSGSHSEDETDMRASSAKLRLAADTTDEIDLVIQDVSMRFNTREGTVTAVDGVSFEIKRGEFVSIIKDTPSTAVKIGRAHV